MGCIAMVTKKFGVSCDTMFNYLSQQEVTQDLDSRKASYFSIIQVMDKAFHNSSHG